MDGEDGAAANDGDDGKDKAVAVGDEHTKEEEDGAAAEAAAAISAAPDGMDSEVRPSISEVSASSSSSIGSSSWLAAACVKAQVEQAALRAKIKTLN